MKKLTTKIISFILMLSLIFSASVPAFATATEVNTLPSAESISLAEDMYKQLDENAKQLFEQELARDTELQRFHKEYIDPNYYTPQITFPQTRAAAVANPLTILNEELIALNLPTVVRYALTAIGSGIAAAGVDGPLPIGDIIGAVLAVGGVAVIAANWDVVGPKWNQIVRAFQKAFSATAKSISRAFAEVKAKVEAKVKQDKAEKQQKKYDQAKKDGKPTDNHSTQSGSSLPTKSKTNSSKDLKDSQGVKQRRYYDKNGNADMDIDYRHGGNETHKFPHQHNWNNGVRGKAY